VAPKIYGAAPLNLGHDFEALDGPKARVRRLLADPIELGFALGVGLSS